MVLAQVAAVGERCRSCAACGRGLASKGYYRATFRSLFGDVPVRVRRLLVCPCHGPGEPKSFAALDLGAGTVAPELAYVTANTGSGRWTRIEDSWVVEQRVGWCAMRRGGEPWRGLLII